MRLNPSFISGMKACAATAALLSSTAALSFPYSYTASGTVGYDVPKPDLASPFPLDVTLPQFSPTLVGNPHAFLLGVELTFISCVQLNNLGMENTSPVPNDISFSQVLNSTFKYPTPVTNPTHTSTPLNPTVSFTQSLPAYDGTTDFGGTSGKTFTIPADSALLEKNATTSFFVTPSDWIAYEGAGTFTVSYDATIGLPVFTGDAGKTFAFQSPEALAKGEVKVTFHYDIPEASTVAAGAALSLLLGAAGWRMRRRG